MTRKGEERWDMEGMRGRDKREGGGSGADREKGDRGRERTSCDGDLPGRAINRVETLKEWNQQTNDNHNNLIKLSS